MAAGKRMVTARSLTTEQAEVIQSRVEPATRYLCKLYARLNETGCPGDDSFRRAVEKAYGAMRDLSMELHYIGCQAGVGRPPKTGDSENTSQSREADAEGEETTRGGRPSAERR
jgi:hypothetical protein